MTRNMETEFAQCGALPSGEMGAKGVSQHARPAAGPGYLSPDKPRGTRVIWSETHPDHGLVAFPDSLVAGDSHTPMINALMVMDGVGGAIEALSAMLGEPMSMTIPMWSGSARVGTAEGATTTTLFSR